MCTGCDPRSNSAKAVLRVGTQRAHPSQTSTPAPLYAVIAAATGHALTKAPPAKKRALAASVGVNLMLNAGWNWLFFRARSPRAGVAGTVALHLPVPNRP
ncbi:tryptophan-rich sensory protein [Streptacidiphilus cavernicola]|uniref:Tryptophan-rich sensory protein n=1 Tax=Streptacidiphilus cavernicola TaxID=3342716 RepID=A0ABV6VSJ6_9ACTN